MTLPHITKKQQQILTYIYHFRFIDRKQIQTLLNHKNHRRIHSWLHDLVEKQCIGRIYSTKLPDNTKPAVYYLGKYGRKLLAKEFTKNNKTKALEQLTKTYKDSQRTEVFRKTCLALVDCYHAFDVYAKTRGYTYKFCSPTSCAADSLYKSFDAFIDLTYKNGKKKEYALIYFTHRTPRRFTRIRSAGIIKFLSRTWSNETSDTLPTLLVVCSNSPIRTYAKKTFTTKLTYYRATKKLTVKLALLHEVTTQGIGAKIWRDVV